MTENERELSQQLFGGQQQSMGAMEALKEGLKEFRGSMYPGLTWDKITSDLGKEFSHQVEAGAHELASLLFTGQGYVQYQRDGKDDQPSHEQAQDGQHLERGGRSM